MKRVNCHPYPEGSSGQALDGRFLAARRRDGTNGPTGAGIPRPGTSHPAHPGTGSTKTLIPIPGKLAQDATRHQRSASFQRRKPGPVLGDGRPVRVEPGARNPWPDAAIRCDGTMQCWGEVDWGPFSKPSRGHPAVLPPAAVPDRPIVRLFGGCKEKEEGGRCAASAHDG